MATPVDLVLGLSITSAAVRLVLVEGATGEGDTVDHDVIDIAAVRAAADARELAETVLHNRVIAAAQLNRPQSIGVTWTAEAAADGSRLLETLAAAGFDDFLAVSEWDAAEALAVGISGLAGGSNVGVCIVEPDAAVVAAINPQGTLVDRIDRRLHNGSAGALVDALVPIVDPGRPEAIFVFGSAADLDTVLSMLRSAIAAPVVSAAEADLALAKGAALAAARALSGWHTQTGPAPIKIETPTFDDDAPAHRRGHRLSPRVAALSSVLAAAVLTFVVSLSVALGLHLTPQADEPDVANAAGRPTMAAKAPVAAAARGPTHSGAARSGPVAPPPEAAPVFDAPEAAPVEPSPVYGPVEPVPAAPAPEPVYVPPAPAPADVPPAPVYVPPNTPPYQPPPQPRLRDRIIEKIPLINRFHEPQYP